MIVSFILDDSNIVFKVQMTTGLSTVSVEDTELVLSKGIFGALSAMLSVEGDVFASVPAGNNKLQVRRENGNCFFAIVDDNGEDVEIVASHQVEEEIHELASHFAELNDLDEALSSASKELDEDDSCVADVVESFISA